VSVPEARGPNGFYLASAACMLAGCYLVSGASSEAPRDVWHLLPILGWLNLYELLLIGVAAFLSARGLVRDGRLLLVLEAMFMADAAHLTGEAVTASGEHWVATAGGLALLLTGKVGLVASLFHVPLARLRLYRAIPPALLLITLPGMMSSVARMGSPVDRPLYGLAWAIGLMLMMESVAHVPLNAAETPPRAADAFASALRLSLLVSLPAHLWASHWLYDAHVYLCSLAPLVLAFAVVVTRSVDALDAPRLRAGLPALAVLLSIPWPNAFELTAAGLTLSPFRLTLAVAALVYLYDFSLHGQRFHVACAAACAALALTGHSVEAIGDHVASLLHTGSRLRRFNTRQWWGGFAVVTAYLLLWLGTRASLRRQSPGPPARE
jgi:hypothetical protein